MMKPTCAALGPFLAASLLLLSAWLRPPETTAEPRLVVERSALLPWRIVHARVEAEAPVTETLSVVGRTWGGAERLLFVSESPPFLSSFEVAFYLDDSVKSLVLETGRGEASRTYAEIPLTFAEVTTPPELPFHYPRLGRMPETFDTRGESPLAFARRASEDLFVSKPPIASAVLLLFGLASCLPAILSLARNRHGRRTRPLLRFGASLIIATAAAVAALAVLPTDRDLYFLGLPDAAFPSERSGIQSGPRLADWEARRSADGEIEGWRVRRWGEGRRYFLGARLRPGSLLPLDLVAEPGSVLRFSYPPLVVGRPDGLFLSGNRFMTGWRFDE